MGVEIPKKDFSDVTLAIDNTWFKANRSCKLYIKIKKTLIELEVGIKLL